jgi:hypothetical protein
MFGIVVFVCTTAVVTAVGRLSFGIDQALSSRYVTASCYFWAAQVIFWALWSQDGRRQGSRLAVAGGLGLGLLTLVFIQVRESDTFFRSRTPILRATSASLGGVDDEQAFLSVYPDAQRVRDLLPFMRSQRLSVFNSPGLYRAGAPFRARIVPTAGRCLGAFDLVDVAAPPSLPRPLLGWGWDLAQGRSFARVAIVDDTGRVVGIGVGGEVRRDVPAAVHAVRSLRSGWIASAAPGNARYLVAYGILGGGAACELGRKNMAG